MNSQTKICQNCKKEFIIEPEDFDFYAKIKVPPPTWCPECRMIRRFLWRNHTLLYKRPDSHTGEIIFSMFSEIAPVEVYERDFWWSDGWNPIEHGRDYDWNKPFFEQFKELIRKVPWPSRNVKDFVRSDYSNNASNLKDCFLVFSATQVENSAYCNDIYKSADCFDGSWISECALTYQCLQNVKCFKALFSLRCENSHDIMFCRDCIGVSYCFGCVDLRNKSYCIFNRPYTRAEYFKKIQEFDLGSYRKLVKLQEEINNSWLKYPVKFMQGRHNNNVSGDDMMNSKDVSQSFTVYGGENVKFSQHLHVPSSKDCFDYFLFGGNGELIYESLICGYNALRLKFCSTCWPACNELSYCILCSSSSSNLFGCISLRNKQYCILNKQYTKEEYEKLVPKIIQHMNEMPYIDKKGRVYKYGEFFPPELSPFAYNETIAQEYFPLTKEEALAQGYQWKDPEERNYQIDIKSEDLPDHIKDVKDDILDKIIGCIHQGKCNEQCTEAFRIIPQELEFYKRMNLPLPRLCPNCRHYQRIKQRNPLKLWHRKCMCAGNQSENGIYKNTASHSHGNSPCPNTFETSYAPNRPEIVYCESCYLNEVV
jgi:hypothetical protein